MAASAPSENGARGARAAPAPPSLAAGPAGRLELEDHPQQRRAEGVARQGELVHQPLEGDVLVGEGAQHGVAGAGEERRETGIAAELGPQHQGVDEEADQPLDLRPRAVGDRHPHRQLRGAGLAVEQGGEPGEERHEEGGVGAVGQPAEPPGDVRRQRPGAEAAAAGGDRRARAVGGEVQRGERRQSWRRQ